MRIINKLLKPFNLQVNKITSLAIDKFDHQNISGFLSELGEHYYNTPGNVLNKKIGGIVFSKNRAMQLHALLASYFHYTKNPAPLTVLFTFSNIEHKQSYEILKEEFATFPVTFILEKEFSFQLKEVINSVQADRVFFMTDDAVFIDDYDLADCLDFDPHKFIFSLRLGADLDYCYTHNKNQSVPVFKEISSGGKKYNSWIWKEMVDSPDWIYPLSVDATIFLKEEISIILKRISFTSPNSLEAEMQHYSKIFTTRTGLCYSKAKYVNVPCNMVQQEFNNLFTGTYSIEELLNRFLAGERIKWEMLAGLKAPAAQVAVFSFRKK